MMKFAVCWSLDRIGGCHAKENKSEEKRQTPRKTYSYVKYKETKKEIR